MVNVVVDIEMNPIEKKYMKNSQNFKLETIEIGAVFLDEAYNEISCFKTLIKPQYNKVIEKRYEKLTHIKTEMVENAPIFEDALNTFLRLCHEMHDELNIYQWSDSDINQILDEIEFKQIKIDPEYNYLLENWIDFQAEFDTLLSMHRQISLNDALDYASMKFRGTRHDALFDARNTAELIKIVHTPELYDKKLNSVVEVLRPKSNVTLGDLFDFSQFSFDD